MDALDHPVVTDADDSDGSPTIWLPPVGPTPIRSTLFRCHEERFSGRVHLEGPVGGWVHFNDGLVVAAVTSAAPGPESLLLKSGRIAETDWMQTYDAAAASGRMAAELVRRGLITELGLEVVCLSALFDAGFAMATYGADTCRVEVAGPEGPLVDLPLAAGVEPERLIKETARRMRAAAPWRRVGVSVKSRPFPASASPASSASARPTPVDQEPYREILLHANGRRTPRDIAFAVGRGLFVVMGEIARMVDNGLLDPGTPGPPGARSPGRVGAGDTADATAREVKAERLPQRRKGASKITEVIPIPSLRRPLLHRLRAIRPEPIAEAE